MRYFLTLFMVWFFLGFFPAPALAHAPGTLPFVLINGDYTLFNPTYQSGATIHSAQDIAIRRYFVGKAVTFSIDTNRIPFPSPLWDQLTFRWFISKGNNFDQRIDNYFYDKAFSYAFTHSGSYMINLEAKVPGGSFSLLDSVLLNVFPTQAYNYPISSVEVQNEQTHIVLQIVSRFDSKAKTASYLWDLGNGILVHGPRIPESVVLVNNFPKTGITARVIDNNGLITDVLLRQETFTRQIDYDTVVYVKGKATSQYGTIMKTVANSSGSNGKGFILGLSVDAFVQNLLILFLSMIGLIVSRVIVSFYGLQRR